MGSRQSVLDKYERIPFVVEEINPSTGKLRGLQCGRGVRANVGGKEIDLFPISVLQEACGRSRELLLDWEIERLRQFSRAKEDGTMERLEATFAILPKSHHKVPDSGIHRWYTKEQILAVRNALIAHEAIKGKREIDWWGVATMIEDRWQS